MIGIKRFLNVGGQSPGTYLVNLVQSWIINNLCDFLSFLNFSHNFVDFQRISKPKNCVVFFYHFFKFFPWFRWFSKKLKKLKESEASCEKIRFFWSISNFSHALVDFQKKNLKNPKILKFFAKKIFFIAFEFHMILVFWEKTSFFPFFLFSLFFSKKNF